MVLKISCKIHSIPSSWLRRNCIGSEGSTHGQTDIYYIPPSRWIVGGIKICAVSNFINTEIVLEVGGGGGGGGGGFGDFFLYEKGSKGKKVLLQDM